MQNQDLQPHDPEIMNIASAFLRGFQQELRNQDFIIDAIESDAGRQRLSLLFPEIRRQWEGLTKEQLESNKSFVAIAVGVAFAVRFALADRETPK